MAYENILYEKKEGIAYITFNRPKVLNALNRQTIDELHQALLDARRDPSVRVLILTGAGEKSFVAGADIAAMSEMSAVQGLEFARLGHRVLQSMEELPVPIIAAVNGFALGGGDRKSVV